MISKYQLRIRIPVQFESDDRIVVYNTARGRVLKHNRHVLKIVGGGIVRHSFRYKGACMAVQPQVFFQLVQRDLVAPSRE